MDMLSKYVHTLDEAYGNKIDYASIILCIIIPSMVMIFNLIVGSILMITFGILLEVYHGLNLYYIGKERLKKGSK